MRARRGDITIVTVRVSGLEEVQMVMNCDLLPKSTMEGSW